MAETVVLTGEFDIARTAEMRDALLEAAHTSDPVVADLSGVTFFDSSALRALLDVRSILADRGQTIRLHDPSPIVRRLLDLTDIAHLFDGDPSAVDQVAPPAAD